jgi:hypothetical protein
MLLMLFFFSYFTNSPKFNQIGKSIFLRSNHPLYGYSFAIVGINITSWVYKWLVDGNLKTHFFSNTIDFDQNSAEKPIEKFNFIYCKFKNENCCFKNEFVFVLKAIIFMEFDRFWSINEVEMIYFEQYAKLFRKCIAKKLCENNFCFNNDYEDDIKNYFILQPNEIEKVSKFQCCINKK